VPSRVSLPSSVARVGLIGLMALFAAACSAPGASPSPSPTPSAAPSPSPAAAVLLIKISSEGGFIGPTATLSALPTVVVYSDGRIFTPGAVPAIYPGPLVQGVSVRNVGPVGARAILDAIRTAALDKPGGGDPGVSADVGTTVFAVVIDGQATTTRFGGMGGGPGRPGGGNPASAAALDLLTRLTDPTETWGSASAGDTAYVPSAFRIFVVPGGPVADPSAPQATLAWPLNTSLDAFGIPAVPDRGISGLRTGIVSGADAAALAPFLRTATTLTPVTSEGQTYTLYVRPLLPAEGGGG